MDPLLPATIASAAGVDRTKVADAAARFELGVVQSREEFEEGYALLALQFAPLGEMEREEVLTAWFDRGSLSPPDAALQARYHMVLARDEAGTIAGVRDFYVIADAAERRVVVGLSHSLVLPPWRRSGLASLFRSVPVPLARRALPDAAEILLGAEMEPVHPDHPDSIVRLMAYGRAGFWAIPPEVLGYAQPDFRDLAALGEEGQPLPLVPVIRQVGEETLPTISRARAWSFVAHFQAAQGCHCDPREMARIRAHAETAFVGHAGDPIPLLPLPRDGRDLDLLAPLLRSRVLPCYPRAWWGKDAVGSPDEELTQLHRTWNNLPRSTGVNP
jgi:hypothetical protein